VVVSRFYFARRWPLWVVPIAYYTMTTLIGYWLFHNPGSDALKSACGLAIAIAACLEREPGRHAR
jgi:hypothetical protein